MAGVIEVPGPWQHRYVAANGARFHVAEATPGGTADAPLVLMLHGFPEFWWAWRHQLPALRDAGYRAAAMDLRGYGGSDKPPRGYDPMTLAQDVAGVVKALGERSAVVVGQGWGGYVGWTAAAQHPREVTALCAVAAPHPLVMLDSLRSGSSLAAMSHVMAMQVPWQPERRLSSPDSGFVRAHMRNWSAPGSAFPDEETVARYQEAISLWPAAHCALEYHRWLVRSRLRSDGRRFNRLMSRPVSQPVCTIAGETDPALSMRRRDRSADYVVGDLQTEMMPAVGHFPPEERPEEFTALLLGWLARVAPA